MQTLENKGGTIKDDSSQVGTTDPVSGFARDLGLDASDPATRLVIAKVLERMRGTR